MANRPAKATVIALIVTTACALCLPLTTASEGDRPKPYWDPAHIRTVCYGETQGIEERIYEESECASMLRRRLANDYALKILKCVPGFVSHVNPFAASIDASYNAGPVAFCRSRMAAQFNAGHWPEGCVAFKNWYVTARVRGKPTVLPGLVRRRANEAKLCSAS